MSSIFMLCCFYDRNKRFPVVVLKDYMKQHKDRTIFAFFKNKMLFGVLFLAIFAISFGFLSYFGFVPTELWRFVKQIKSPIIYILGGRSNIVPAETQQQLKQTLPQVQIESLPGLGHYPSEENTKDYLVIADRFLAGLKR